MQQLLIFLLILPSILGGTQCPPRKDIYPCICLDRPIGKKKFETTLICQNTQNTDSVMAIDRALTEMEIDKFLLYDSFWSKDATRSQSPRMSVSMFTDYKIKDIEVVDSKLEFLGCPEARDCRINFLKRFVAINTTIIDGATCGNNGVAITAWVTCPNEMEHFEIREGPFADGIIRSDFFPPIMSKMKVLILRNNGISKIERRTFNSNRFPALDTLDLSHNVLRDVRSLFSSKVKLRHLDLSYNPIRTVVDLQYLPDLHSLKLIKCQIVHLLENEWQQVPTTLRIIDLSYNALQCNCGFKWANSTFHINAQLIGTCVLPKPVENMKLRRASRLLSERCDENSVISPSKIKKKTK